VPQARLPFHEASTAARYAAQSGNIELMAWMLQQPAVLLSAHAMAAAALKGHAAMCQYLHAQQCPWSESSTSAVAAGGHAELLRWLVDNGCPWEEHDLCMSAAQAGSTAALAFLQQRGLLNSTATLTAMLNMAALNQKLGAAVWLQEQGADWPVTFRYHPWSGEALAWARAEGCTTPTH
jgi:hypothetical protein